MPSRVTVSDIKSKFLRPSLTSYFEVEVPMPGAANLGDPERKEWISSRLVLQNGMKLKMGLIELIYYVQKQFYQDLI